MAVSLRSRKRTALIKRAERTGRSKEEETQKYEAEVGAAGFKRPRKVRNMSARALERPSRPCAPAREGRRGEQDHV